ncbi:MAG TPA: ABC transporter substrate-binding protein [Caulobacteraceae bacterium]|jgi:iron complex transport system substrate-binding protein|nr:ABC transporter substrate-binding protein [Caulobacteraceae bacterium]
MRGLTAAALGLALAISSAARAAPRIVSLDQCADQYVLALAPRGEIAGLSKRALNGDSAERALAVGLPELRPTLESVLGAQASIVVYYWSADARLPDELRRRGIAAVQIDEANDFPGIRANIRKIAAAVDQRAAGEALVARMDADLARASGAWGGARALYLTTYGFTAGKGTLVGAMMNAAGLSTAATSDGYSPAPLEALVLNPPQALVLGFFRDLAGGRQHWSIAGNGYLRGLVAKRAIASLPGSVLGCPAWTAAEGALALAQARQGR